MSNTEFLDPRKRLASHAERRLKVQAAALHGHRRRQAQSRLFFGLLGLALFIAFIPLFSILENVITKGLKVVTWGFLSHSQSVPSIIDPSAYGGVWDAISGSLLIDGLAVVISVPLAVITAMALFEFDGPFIRVVRRALQIIVGMPSVLAGIFVYSFVVVPFAHGLGAAYAGSLALTVMMLPLMAIAGESALRETPSTLREAALAVGARPSGMMRRVILPYSLPRLLTGILLSLSRAVGETAPILFVIGAATLPAWNPGGQVASLPTLLYDYLGSQYPSERNACWGIALILMASVLVLNLSSRLISARMNKGSNV
jgi:phosphate transport system permease protein